MNIRINLILPETIIQSLRYIFVADSMGLSSFKFLWWAQKTHVFWNRVRNGPSRSSKVIDFGINRKRVYNFLLVSSRNFGPVLPRFRNIAGFLLRTATLLLFHPNFGRVSLAVDYRCCGYEVRRPELTFRVITFELTQHIRPRYINITDRQTDGRTTYDVAIPRCTHSASCGKNANDIKVLLSEMSFCDK